MWRAKFRLPMTIVLALALLGAGIETSFQDLQAAPPTQPAQQPAAIDQAPPPTPAPTDGWGDPLPSGASLRLGTVRFRHPDVSKVLFSPDGKILASVGGNSDRMIRLWDPNSGAELHALPGHRNGVGAFAFAPDGKTLVTGSGDKPIRLWNVATGKEIRTFVGHQNGSWLAVFTPNGEMLASVGGDNTIRLWAVDTGMEIRAWATKQDRISAFVFSPDGKMLVSADWEGTIRLWNVETGKEIRTLTEHHDVVWSIAFSPDGLTLASASEDQTIRFWNPATGEVTRTLPNPSKTVINSIAFSPDGESLVAAGRDSTIRFWTVGTGKESHSWKPSQWSVSSVAFSPDGKTLASGSSDGLVRQWEPATGKEVRPRAGHQSTVRSIAFALDGKRLVTLDSGTVRFWDPVKGEVARTLTTRPDWPNGGCQTVAYSADGKTLATLDHGDGGLSLWDAATGERIRTKNLDKAKWNRWLAFAPDGKTLALTGGDAAIRFWDVDKGSEVRVVTGHLNGIAAIAFSPDGKTVASGGYDNTVRFWDVGAGQETRILWNPSPVEALVFAPDGRILATSGGNTDRMVRIWDVGTGKQLQALSGHNQWVRTVAFSSDGKTLAAGSDNEIWVWETATGKEIRSMTGHRGLIQCLAFSPDGKSVASGSADTTALVWRIFEKSTAGADVSEKDLQSLWTDLAGDDAILAYRAIGALASVPRQSASFLRQRLPTAIPAPDPKHLAQLLADLESDQFVVRQRASQELDKLAKSAELVLRAAMDGKPSVAMRQRLEQLLETATAIDAEELRWQRVIQALEMMPDAEPKPVLTALANEAPSMRLRQHASSALERLAKRTRN